MTAWPPSEVYALCAYLAKIAGWSCAMDWERMDAILWRDGCECRINLSGLQEEDRLSFEVLLRRALGRKR